MQRFQNWVSDVCKYVSILDKNVWPLMSLGWYYFQKEKEDRSIIQNLLLHWKDWWSLLEELEDATGKVLWKIYNQDISWRIKRKILIGKKEERKEKKNRRKESISQNGQGWLHKGGWVGTDSWRLDLFWIIGEELRNNSINKSPFWECS